MTLAELKTQLETTGYSVAYEHFPEPDVPDFPYITYTAEDTVNFQADDVVYFHITTVNVILWTKHKNTNAEAEVEAALKDVNITWEKYTDYQENEKCYSITYEFDI